MNKYSSTNNIGERQIPVYDLDRVFYDKVTEKQKELAEEEFSDTDALIKASELYYNIFLVKVFPNFIMELINLNSYALATEDKNSFILRGNIEFMSSPKPSGTFHFVPEYNKMVVRINEDIDDKVFVQLKILINNMLSRNGIGSISGSVHIRGTYNQLRDAYKNELNYLPYYYENMEAIEEDYPKTLK